MNVQTNVSLAQHTSFGVGGNAENYVEITDVNQLNELGKYFDDSVWILGEGSNTLISDLGLPGLTIAIKNSGIDAEETEINVAAGTNWDEFVRFSMDKGLWGVELMSGIPGNVGAAVAGNIAAYGQSVSDTLVEVEVFDYKTMQTKNVSNQDLNFGYRESKFHSKEFASYIITAAKFKLSKTMKTKLKYQSALSVAEQSNLDEDNLLQRREIIMKTRVKAGSIFNANSEKTAGSFYKNPLLSKEVAEYVMSFEEKDIPKQQIIKQNKLHGGDEVRVSAAHIMLAAGFKRGQQWGQVKLHPEHVLKIVNLGGATAQDIFNVNLLITSTVKEKLGVELEPEVKFLGKF